MSVRLVAGVLLALAVSLTAAPYQTKAAGFGFATFSAAINANGQTTRSSGVNKSKRSGLGQYVVTFTRKVKACTYVASPQGKNGGQASVSKAGKKKIRVDTFANNGVRANMGFTLLLSCI